MDDVTMRVLTRFSKDTNTARWYVEDEWDELAAVPDNSIKTEDGKVYISDGREVFLFGDKYFVPKQPAILFRKRREPFVADARPARSQIKIENVCSLIIDGVLCGGDLISRSVCANSSLGKSNIAVIQTCKVCGASFAIRRS
jgi:hypothetical protein